MKTVVLYSTLGCHLCEQAKQLMSPLLAAAEYRLEEVDISESEQLMERYQLSIPVARNSQSGDELCWPFDAAQVADFLGIHAT